MIMYVTLSGKFPFDEDIDIDEQIKNLSCMFPDHPWANISFDGKKKRLINFLVHFTIAVFGVVKLKKNQLTSRL